MEKNCVICKATFHTESVRREVCRNRACRKARKSQVSHQKEREKPWVKARSRLQDRYRDIMKKSGLWDSMTTEERRIGTYLRATTRRFKVHMQRQFKDGMKWEHVGFEKKDKDGNVVHRGLVSDHIVPVQFFKQSDPEHRKVCWHILNYRPEEHIKNLKKHDRIDLSIIPERLKEMLEKIGVWEKLTSHHGKKVGR